jgi:hypothetical protein
MPSNELAFAAYMRAVDGVPTDKVGTILPNDLSKWASTGFVQLTVVGGSPSIEQPRFSPVVQVDVWGVSPNSPRPPWDLARDLVANIRWNIYNKTYENKVYATRTGYYGARVLTVYLTTEPAPVEDNRVDDGSGFARLQFDVMFNWTPAVT